jgi:hypothetical protein
LELKILVKQEITLGDFGLPGINLFQKNKENSYI